MVRAVVAVASLLVSFACTQSDAFVRDFCVEAGKYARFSSLRVGATEPDEVRALVRQTVSSGRRLIAFAPREIRPDVRTSVASFERIAEAIEEADWDMSRVPPSVFEQDAATRRAAPRIQRYLKDHCETE